MGILSPIQKQFIKRPDNAKNQIVYKWPDANIRMHTKITVEPDEKALFIKEGVVKGIVDEGVHTLDGANIPFIGGLLSGATGGNYFVSEIYFVSIREFVNQLFGGTVDNVIDPSTELAVGLKCFGEYSVKVVDPSILITNLVGTTNISSMGEINEWVASQLLKIVRETVVSHIIATDESARWDILGLASKNEELENETVGMTNDLIKSYGLNITRLGNITISISDEDAATLKQLKRDLAYRNNAGAADAAVKLGAAKGLETGTQNPGLFAAGLGFGYAATQGAVQGVATGVSPCPECGKNIPHGSEFCMFCGHKI